MVALMVGTAGRIILAAGGCPSDLSHTIKSVLWPKCSSPSAAKVVVVKAK